jgi:phosphorylase kinase alpha/beta subunit
MDSISILKQLQTPKGLFLAAPAPTTGYNKSWLRDNIYEALGLEAIDDYESVIKTYHALLDVFLKQEDKITRAILKKPKDSFDYIHARYHPETFDQFNENWGNKQNDAVGAFLFKIGDLLQKRIKILRNDDDYRIVQKLIYYLESLEFWQDSDNGVWEEYEEIHASSVGACVAGLKKLKPFFDVPEYIILLGEYALNRLLPDESSTKEVDLAQLSLIYPYNVTNPSQTKAILENVEKHLVRKRGIIRYKGDAYYNQNGEAEWTFGFPWLAIIYKKLGDMQKYNFYMMKTYQIMNDDGELPELYFADSEEHNENSPLGWSQAMLLVAEK